MMNEQMTQETDSTHSHQCQCGAGKKCKCPHHKVAPIAIGLIGVVFLLEAFSIISPEITAIVWPILLIIAAGTKAFGRRCSCC